jgi:Tfp pilus assembly protein PilF
MRQALDRFEAAIARDPQYAAAFAGLADTYTALGYGNYLSPTEAFSKGRKAAERALELGAARVPGVRQHVLRLEFPGCGSQIP